jgi:hypothetical protein
MTDRELLEMAAKAAGIAISEHIGIRHDYFADEITGKEWNPLTDDGDALRLAVKLGLQINAAIHSASMDGNSWTAQAGERDGYAATRRAIVRSAAAIGEKQ